MAATKDLKVWDNQTPVVNINTDGEFDVWENLTPDEDIDEGGGGPTTRRRLVFEF